MRILILHSRYLSGHASGENAVVEDEARLLSEGGHQVQVWQPAPEDAGGAGLVGTAAGAIWSRHAAQEIARRMRGFRPDVVHYHNLFPTLSPAAIRIASRSTATVMTLHNYRLMCLPATFLRDGNICEDCLHRTPWPGVVHRCYRGSLAGSATLAASLSLHRALRTFDRISLYLAVSDFVRAKYVEAGFPPDRLRVKSNFAQPTERRHGPGDYFLFVGRLAPEKGVHILLEAWRAMPAKLLIVGDGPESRTLRASATGNVEFVGMMEPSRVAETIRGARALLLPSTWYEAQPRVIPEAYAAGVPVIASRIGGLPDLVIEGQTGSLVAPGDPPAWAAAAERLIDDDVSSRLGDGAYRQWEERYNPKRALEALEEAYREAIALRDNGTRREAR
jgi:glycosyltransferase involved in cell wall biosynthesis